MLLANIPYQNLWTAGVIGCCLIAGAIVGGVIGALRRG